MAALTNTSLAPTDSGLIAAETGLILAVGLVCEISCRSRTAMKQKSHHA